MEAPRSALATFGIKKWPQGTIQELEATGQDVRNTPSCAAPGDGIKGCPYWEQCRFGLDSMGAFKGHGPKYVAVRQINPVDGTASQDINTCYNFTHTLQPRADAGAALRRTTNGKRGEVIRVIAQEGEEFVQNFYFPVNARGEVINAMPELMPVMDANGVKYSTLPREEAVTYKFFEMKRIVPKFPRPGNIDANSFAQRVAMWDLPNEAKDLGMKPPVMPQEMAEPMKKPKLAEKA